MSAKIPQASPRTPSAPVVSADRFTEWFGAYYQPSAARKGELRKLDPIDQMYGYYEPI